MLYINLLYSGQTSRHTSNISQELKRRVFYTFSEMTIGFKIMKDVKDSMNELIDIIFHECRYNPRVGQSVIKVRKPKLTAYTHLINKKYQRTTLNPDTN